jgi:hypothetical protein
MSKGQKKKRPSNTFWFGLIVIKEPSRLEVHRNWSCATLACKYSSFISVGVRGVFLYSSFNKNLKQQQHLPFISWEEYFRKYSRPARLPRLRPASRADNAIGPDLDRYRIICKGYKDHTEHRFLTNAYTYIVGRYKATYLSA